MFDAVRAGGRSTSLYLRENRIDRATKAQLNRGQRMVELLKQPQHKTMDVIDQVLQIFAASKGFMDDLKVSQVNAFANALVDYFNSAAKAVRDELAQARAISKELEPKLLSAINDFKQGWTE